MASKKCNGILYVIREGDTLYRISRMYQVPLALIMRANPYVDVYNLQVGDEICIPLTPGGVTPPIQPMPWPYDRIVPYVVQIGDTLDSILNRFGLTIEDFLKYNEPDTVVLQEGTHLRLPSVSPTLGNVNRETAQGGKMGQSNMMSQNPARIQSDMSGQNRGFGTDVSYFEEMIEPDDNGNN